MSIVLSIGHSGFSSRGKDGFHPAAGFVSPTRDGTHRRIARRPSFAISETRPQRRDAPLACLAGGVLQARFHSWRGASGRRYICSVFPVQEGKRLGGLPEFDSAIALAVSRTAENCLEKIAAVDICWREGRFTGDFRAIAAALRSGASSWHIHLLATDSNARRSALDDLAS